MITIKQNKKAIAPLVAFSLLLILIVSSVTLFQISFQSYFDGVLNDVESNSNEEEMDNGINRVIDNTLYFKNNNQEDIQITQIKAGDVDCGISTSVSTGVEGIELGSCTQNQDKSIFKVVVYTNVGIFSSTISNNDVK